MLTDEEIDGIFDAHEEAPHMTYRYLVARAIEKAVLTQHEAPKPIIAEKILREVLPRMPKVVPGQASTVREWGVDCAKVALARFGVEVGAEPCADAIEKLAELRAEVVRLRAALGQIAHFPMGPCCQQIGKAREFARAALASLPKDPSK